MICGVVFTRLVKFFREEWRQLLAITIAIVLPAGLVNIGRATFWPLLSDTCFEMGVFFILAALLGRWGKWLCHITFIISIIDFGLSLGNYLATGQEVSLHTIYLIMGTNPDEASEFFSFYFPLSKIILWTAAIFLLCLLYFAPIPRWLPNKKFSQIGTVVFLVTAILCFPSMKRDMYYWFNKTLPIKYLLILKDYEPLNKVAENRHDIPLVETTTKHPQNIIIIIGESFSKSHSSIYGYKRETNPELAQLAEEGNLLAFTQCTAPAPFTHLAFKNILSLWNSDEQKVNSATKGILNGLKKLFLPWNENKDNWYDYPTFFDVFSQNYTIRWISNQDSNGMFDNVQATFAALSDTVWYAQLHPEAGSRYDQVVVPVVESFLKNDTLPNITIVNIMGQHEDFTHRYPSSWEYFKPEDYREYPAHQRERLAQYDNATRYNDHVVTSIFNLYKNDCAMVFYFPDHGLDLYESDPNYIGHAADRSQKSWDASCQIPFFIYVTNSYQEKFPQQVEQLRHSLHKPFNTKNIIYTLLQITGWKLSQDNGKEGQYLLQN